MATTAKIETSKRKPLTKTEEETSKSCGLQEETRARAMRGLLQTVANPLLTCVVLLACVGGRGPVVQAGSVASPPRRQARGLNTLDIPLVAIGKCRVQCLKKIGIPTIRGWKTNSKKYRYFQDCWKICEDRQANPQVFGPLCREHFCSRGCQTACTYWNNPHPENSHKAHNVSWRFENAVITDTDYVWITMEWTAPTPQTPLPHPHLIVYNVLMRENKNEWKFIDQTYEQEYRMRHDEAAFVPEFLIQAIDETGVIARSVFNVSKMLFTNVIQPVAYDALSEGDGGEGEGGGGGGRGGRKSPRVPNKINLTHTLTYEAEDGLEARLSWNHPQGSPHVGGKVDYEVLNILMRCGVYPDLPRCFHTDDLYASYVVVKLSDKPQYTLKHLLFNTRYLVRVQLPNQSPPDGQLAQLLLDTPRCDVPSRDFRRCILPSDVIATTVTSPNVTGSETNVTSGLSAREEGDGGGGGTGKESGESTEPYLLTELIRDVKIQLLPTSPLHHRPLPNPTPSQIPEEGQVMVNVSWTYISDPRQVSFALTFKTFDSSGLHVVREEVTGVTSLVVTLLDNTLYEMVIELVIPPESLTANATGEEGGGGGLGEGEGQGEAGIGRGVPSGQYVEDSRQRLEFNTSQLQLATRERHQAVRMNKKNLRAVNGVIIGVTSVGVIIVIAVVIVFLYKKRQSFKGIIIPKTTVAKSNSYKSSVGGKGDYSNQLMVFCDEWELDPKLLKFSTPLGQGAFGKVVTGYYSDHKVAIKLVKEGAPTSYREDLVAEINLMKRLGTHPNIVCLVGACTVSDPTALIMEYVPFGNLQNFLKKCRMEGDLQKRSNGPSEIQYSMLQDCGGIENGVITPTDMLSFARQVAMAMAPHKKFSYSDLEDVLDKEYLAEKKYVHRDLAARNILLHYNKVVKVCDFGLSRDIFHDNQYKKLTNGKLPLKWMAIESLRDRVFTTQSDVWSFGILLWEIVTMGASPYPNIALADLYYVLSNHYRMDKPSNCSNELYSVMRRCWEESPLDRPCFCHLRQQLEDLMAEDRDYLVLEDIDVPLSTSESSSNPNVPELFSGELLPSQAARQAVSVSSYESGSSSSATTSGGMLLKQGMPANRRPPMTIDVCIHQKSTERLMRPSESDSSP